MISVLNKKGLIYVVDNSHLYRVAIKTLLDEEGYSVQLFENCCQLLRAISANKEYINEVPDIIICDMNTQINEGLDLYDEVNNASQRISPVFFIFMTENNEEIRKATEQRNHCVVVDKLVLLHPLAEVIQEVYPSTKEDYDYDTFLT